MNKVILTGRFTHDPEIKYTNDGTSIARFSIAVNRRFVKEGSDQKADSLIVLHLENLRNLSKNISQKE